MMSTEFSPIDRAFISTVISTIPATVRADHRAMSIELSTAAGMYAGMRLALAYPEWTAGFLALSTAPDSDGDLFRRKLVEAVPVAIEGEPE